MTPLARARIPLVALLALLAIAPTAAAAEVDTGDTAWVLLASAFVMLMVPGLALFYGGMVRRKNVVATLVQVLLIMAVVSIQWPLLGYTLAFGSDIGGFIGGLDHLGMIGVGGDPSSYAPTIPGDAFMVFQMMFAIITPALIIGGIAERVSYKALVLFTLLWSTLVYDPLAHWVWGEGGWLREMGALDFAGGTVVHVAAGVAALACVLFMGHRIGWKKEEMSPNSVPLVFIGAGLLWFGWFGFNAGSAVASGATAASAFVATHLAAGAATFAWATAEWLHRGKPTAVGATTGAVAGLVAITPASGFVLPVHGLAIGAISGLVCYGAVVLLKHRLGLDDSLDAFGVHGVGGVAGALLTGIFATAVVDPIGQLQIQAIAVAASAAFVFPATWGILWVVDALVGLRVAPEEEQVGLDLSHHGERAYDHCDHPPAGAASFQGASSVLLKK